MILFLEPYFEAKPWAGNELNKMFDCESNTGEAWIVSGYKNKSSIVKGGKYSGQTLRHIWRKHPELFGEFEEKEFPLLLKLISAKENLSVQVHPNDDYALKNNNQLGKFECWYVLKETEADSVILGIDVKNASELETIINAGKIEDFLIKRPIKKDDLVIVEPGDVHAICSNTFVLEVQESSDITYRLYDFNRGRELNIADSLNVINYNNLKNPIANFKKSDVFVNKHFDITKMFVTKEAKRVFKYRSDTFRIVYIVGGEGSVNQTPVKSGDSFIITAGKEEITIEGAVEIIVVTPKKKGDRSKVRKTALITGIVGQDGSYLADLLLEKGYEVHGLIHSRTDLKHSSLIHLTSNAEVMDKTLFFHLGDITDTSNMNRLIENVRPDEIYHLAGQEHVDLSFDIPEYTTQVNSLGTLRILDAIKQNEIRTKFFGLSTSQLFSGDDDTQDEFTRFDPKSPYATSKLYSYFAIKNYRENYNLFAVNGVFFNHMSIRRDDSFVPKKIIDFAKAYKNTGSGVLELGNINTLREFGDARDYVKIMWLMLQSNSPKDFVVGTGKSITTKEFVTMVFKHIGVNLVWNGVGLDEVAIDSQKGNVVIKINPKYFRVNDAKSLTCSSKTYAKDLGFELSTDIDKLIDEMLED